ncbi:MAG: HlyD family efflux transporter periplasmic adaptor subunit [Planctomycetaceae bacterium]|nr:HlyD family efflux transporter periplasmic adaptor subunit [Planctomycetaceae bacterium]
MNSAHKGQASKRRDEDLARTDAKAGRSGSQRRVSIAAAAALFLLASAAWAGRPYWLPLLGGMRTGANHELPAHPEGVHSHGEEPPAVGGDVSELALSEQGRKNIGLTLETVALGDFERTIAIPATLVERPGQTKIVVSAPMTGIVTGIYPIRGEAVEPGDPLFDLRLTHEDLVEKQSSLLRALEELDVVKREVARLEDVTATGAVAGKRLLEQEYEQNKIEASIRAERQALLLHGLSEEQIQKIVDERQLQHNLSIAAPELDKHAATQGHEDILQVTEVAVSVGEHVQTGTRLATLTDHCELYIEGKAFEQDADALNRAAGDGAEVTAVIEGNGSGDHAIGGLQLLHVENEVERESRALKFYVLLPNTLVRNELTADGHRFIGWRYKPGQRVEVRVPVERWERRIVLPVEAVIEEGPERYVYQEVQGKFRRRAVHVEYRDQRQTVIESDGTLFPGDKVAVKGAYQIHLAVKNKAGGGPDPHAGHHH